jgi:hypothetical protein
MVQCKIRFEVPIGVLESNYFVVVNLVEITTFPSPEYLCETESPIPTESNIASKGTAKEQKG